MSRILTPLIIVLMLAVSSSAFAQVPYVPKTDTSQWDPFYILSSSSVLGKSIAIYENFLSDDDLDAFSFRLLEDDFDTDLSLNGFTRDDTPPIANRDVPLIVTDDDNVTGRKIFLQTQTFACQAYSNMLPTIALVGPVQEYLPPHDGETVLPFKLHSDQGICIIENDPRGDTRIEYDTNTFKSLVELKGADFILTKPGLYKIYVWEPNGNTGSYRLKMGHIQSLHEAEIARSLHYIFWQVHDGDIPSEECQQQLTELDGPNPTSSEAIEVLIDTL